MCCPRRGGSRGAKAKRVILFDNEQITKFRLGSACIAVAHFFDKLLKFLKFMLRQTARTALGLESLHAPSGRHIRQLFMRTTQLARSFGSIVQDLCALEELLPPLALRRLSPPLHDL